FPQVTELVSNGAILQSGNQLSFNHDIASGSQNAIRTLDRPSGLSERGRKLFLRKRRLWAIFLRDVPGDVIMLLKGVGEVDVVNPGGGLKWLLASLKQQYDAWFKQTRSKKDPPGCDMRIA